MPLKPNYLQSIQGVVTSGKDLPVEQAGALLAAYESAERCGEANRQQISTLQTQVFDLTKERDETQRLRREVELEIDHRVTLRTRSLAVETEQAKEDKQRFQDLAKSTADDFSRAVEFYRKQLHTAALIIMRLRTDVEVSPAWWRRWSAHRHNQKVLEQCEKELPSTIVESWMEEPSDSLGAATTQTVAVGGTVHMERTQDQWKSWAR